MNATLELSNELYGLSRWCDTEQWYTNHDAKVSIALADPQKKYCPKYSLGYLQRKLLAVDWVTSEVAAKIMLSKEPENIACKLLIDLFKGGLITEQSGGSHD